MKDKFSKIVKGGKDLKDTATKLTQDAAKNAGVVKAALRAGVDTSKGLLDKAKKAVDPATLKQGLDVTTKGVELAAKGARVAAKGYETIASTMEKASEGMKKLGTKLTDKNGKGPK